ncbi:hypothetical protein BC941DRAFT_191053 [Chlamydoabsidia padenii]|nr:hypothetical protein BC941DRAFT_191053 [Chlamydoabsidia padenii]
MKKNKTKTIETSLRLDSNSILKEIGRLGACNGSCHYCRDWALFVYKKHFGGKQQQPTINADQLIMKVGEFSVGIKHPDFPKHQVKPSIESLFPDLDSSSLNEPSLANNMTSPLKTRVSACKDWIKMPTSNLPLPNYFLPLQFGMVTSPPDPDKIVDGGDGSSEISPSYILRQLTCDRQGLLLSVDQIGLLSNIDTMANHSRKTEPCCEVDHIGCCFSPSELETERAIVNESMAKCVKEESVVLYQALESCWGVSMDWMTKVETLDGDFNDVIGSGLDKAMTNFVNQYGLVFPFQDYWTPLVSGFKKKPTKKTNGGGADMLATVDETFINYMDQISKVTEDFYMTFISSIMVSNLEAFKQRASDDFNDALESLKDRENVMERACKEMVGQIKDMAEMAKTKKERLSKMKQKIAQLPESVQQDLLDEIQSEFGKLDDNIDSMMDEIDLVHKRLPEVYNYLELVELIEGHTTLVNDTIKNIKEYAHEKWNEQKSEIDQLKHIYLEESLPNVASRIEKVAHKDFRKKLKKIEHRYSTMRQGFAYHLKIALFPSNTTTVGNEGGDKKTCIFYHVALKMLMAMMNEGVTMEIFLLNACVKKFNGKHKKLINTRSHLATTFACCIVTGQHELAIIIKSMVLAEGKRLEFENEAIHREMSLAKSMGGKPSSNNSNNNTSVNNTGATSLYAAIAMLSTTNGVSFKKKKMAKSDTTDTKNETTTCDKTLESSTSSSISNNVKSEKLPLSVQTKQTQSSASKLSTVKPATSSSKSTNVISTSVTSKPTTAPSTHLSKHDTTAPTPTNKSVSAHSPLSTTSKSKAAIIPPPPINNKNQMEKKKVQFPIAKKSTQPTVTEMGDKDQICSKAPATSVPVHAASTNKDQCGDKTEKICSFSRKRHQLQTKDNQQQKDNISNEIKVTQLTDITESTDEQQRSGDPWTTPPSSSSSSSSNMTWCQTVGCKLPPPKQTNSWTPPTKTTTRTSPSPISSPSSNVTSCDQPYDVINPDQVDDSWKAISSSSSWNQPIDAKSDQVNSSWNSPIDMKVIQTDSWNTVSPSSSWNQPTISSSSNKPSVSSTPADPARETSSWGLSNSGWEEPATQHATKPPVTNAITDPIPKKKERWSSDWATKAKSSIVNNNDTGSSFNNKVGNDGQQEPVLVNVSLKDILAHQENHTTGDINNSNGNGNNNNSRLPERMSLPPALGDDIIRTQQQQQQLNTMADMNQLYQLNQDTLVNMIQSLRCENQQLQQSMMSMQQALTMTMTLAKEREEQTLQLMNTRKQTEMEEARIYILSLEAQIKELRSQQARPSTTNAFVNQDLFANYRQEIHTDDQQQPYRNNNNNINGGQYSRRPHQQGGKKLHWQYNKSVVKCSNCGESDHISSECAVRSNCLSFIKPTKLTLPFLF